MNKAVRDALLALTRAWPDDPEIKGFADLVTAERNALWKKWKRAVPAELQGKVTSGRDAHHGPSLREAGSLSMEEFKEAYQSAAAGWRRRLANLCARRKNDQAVAESTRRIVDHLDKVDAVLK